MTVRRYFSTDASAPVLDGTAGSVLNVLDACLVNGYGSRVAAGWSSPFTGTNKRVYRNASPGGSPGEGTQFYLRVDDTGNVTALARGYTSMSDVDTGSGAFPTTGQVGGSGVTLRKSSAASATTRPWGLIANEKFFILIAMTDSTVVGEANSADCSFLFGDFRSYLTADAYNSLIVGSSTSGTSKDSFLASTVTASTTLLSGHYLARDYTNTGNAVGFNISAKRYASTSGSGPLPQSGPMGGSYSLSRAYIVETTGSSSRIAVRGYIDGIWYVHNTMNGTPLRTFDTIEVTAGPLIGRTLMYVRTQTDGFFVEISDTW